MRFTRALFAFLALAATVLADFSINSPVEGTVWKSGGQESVTWIPQGNGFDQSSKFNVELMQGDPKALKLVKILAEAVSESGGKVAVAVPENLPTGDDYVIRIKDKYTHAFKIEGTGAAPKGDKNDTSSGPPKGSDNSTAKDPKNSTDSKNSTDADSPKNSTDSKNDTKGGNTTKNGTEDNTVSLATTHVTSMAALVPVVGLAITWF